MRRVALVLLAACGRLGFDTTGEIVPQDAPRADAPPNAMTMTFVPKADTYLSQDMETVDERVNNFGADDRIRVKFGEEHGLLRFEVGTLPPAQIFSADLVLAIDDDEGVPNVMIGVFPLRESWNEGTQDGAPGFANWTTRDEMVPWSTPGASPPNSASAMVTSFAVTSLDPVAVALPPSLVAGWRDAPGTNFGVLLMAVTDNDTDFASREAGTTRTPKLVVTYVP